MLTTEVENYPGFPEPIMGPELMQRFREQAKRMGVNLRSGSATGARLDGPPHTIIIDGEIEIVADAVIVATGASAMWLGLENEQRLRGRGVSSCAVCDGFFFRGEKVAVVGGGDTACEDALYLSNICPEVHMLVRRNQMRASKIMQERVKSKPNIIIHWNTVVKDVLGKDQVEGVLVYNRAEEQELVLDVKALFVAIGHKPNSEFLRGQIEMDEQGYIITRPGSTHTSVEGVFAAGDVHDKVYRQAITAAASGCMAALDAERWLSKWEVERASKQKVS